MADSLILGRYRRIETLGQGGSGAVDLCWDTLIQRRVAIKRMPMKDDGTGRAPGLFEARTGALLNHPSIVSVYNFETTRDEALLIMEAIEGPSLADLIDATPPATFDLDILTSIATAVANALDYAHENQVLHLDIKPDNILITKNGTTKVSDFGISELAGSAGFSAAGAGTIGYMPPEQMEGQRLDQRCDEFAFAMVIYEMLTGRNPYLAKTLNAGLKALRKNPVVPPSTLRDDIGPEVDDILLTALSLDREYRYLTVYDFFDELLPWLGDARAGIDKLRDVVNYDDEAESDEEAPERRRFWDVLSPQRKNACMRVTAAALSWGVSAQGLSACTPLDAFSACGIALTAALAALFKPAFGAVVALLTLGASLIAAGGTLAWLGLAIVAWTVAWFALLGRDVLARPETAVDVNCAFGVLPFGCIWLAPLAPLFAGFFLPPKRAATACVTAALVSLALGTATGTGSLLHFAPLVPETPEIGAAPQLLAQPGTWIVLFGWILSTISLSLLRLRATRVSSILGGIVASCLMLAACGVARWVTDGTAGLPDTPWLLSIGASAVVVIVCGALSAPLRDKGED